MANKINSTRRGSKRPDRNEGQDPGLENNNNRHVKSNTPSPEQVNGNIEKVSRRGYYSRNGGYSGYRGL